MRGWRDGWWVGLLALLARLSTVVWAASRIGASADGYYYHRLAERLASGEGYTWLWPDGVVTYAAHYPVGYPAILAGPYALFGASPAVAMVVNALLGALGCWALYAVLRRHAGPRTAAVGGSLAALHPGLLLYTPALMTEGIVAALWAIAAWLGGEAAQSPRGAPTRYGWLVAAALVMGLATLVRPQSVLLAPAVGLVALPAARGRGAVLATSIAVAACLPWTLRNCERMGRCAFVSVNGGWNLLIGTDPEGRGGWAPLKVPEDCVAVFDEAAKDRCFEEGARRRIVSEPLAWLSLAPRKLAVTFDYCGAPGWYLHEADPDAFGPRAKLVLGVIETAYERALLVMALLAAWWRGRRREEAWRARARGGLLLLGVLSALWVHALVGWLALAFLLATARRLADRPTWLLSLAAVTSLVLVHATFFGAGRYQLVVWLLLLGVAADGVLLSSRWLRRQPWRRRTAV